MFKVCLTNLKFNAWTALWLLFPVFLICRLIQSFIKSLTMRPYIKEEFSLKNFEHNYIEKVFLNMWTMLISAIFCISLSEGFPAIFLICVSALFLHIPSAPIIIGTTVLFKCRILEISISSYLYFKSLSDSFSGISSSYEMTMSLK